MVTLLKLLSSTLLPLHPKKIPPHTDPDKGYLTPILLFLMATPGLELQYRHPMNSTVFSM